MKPQFKYPLLAVLLIVVIYPSIYLPNVMQETRQLTSEMNTQLDSLRQLLHRYDQTLLHYDTAYHQLVHAKKKLTLIEQYHNEQYTEQRAELLDILSQLQELSGNNLHTRPVPMHQVDSLLFKP